MSHTIVLFQWGADKSTRRWFDYASVEEAVYGVLELYEVKHTRARGAYSAKDLFDWLDTVHFCSCMVLDRASGRYTPRGADYLKEQVYKTLKSQALAN